MKPKLLITALLATAIFVPAAQARILPVPPFRIFTTEAGAKPLRVDVSLKGVATARWMNVDGDGPDFFTGFPLKTNPDRILVNPERDIFVSLNTQGKAANEHALIIYKSDGTVLADIPFVKLLSPVRTFDGPTVPDELAAKWAYHASFDFDSTESTNPALTDKDNDLLRITFPWDRRLGVRLRDGEVKALPSLKITKLEN